MFESPCKFLISPYPVVLWVFVKLLNEVNSFIRQNKVHQLSLEMEDNAPSPVNFIVCISSEAFKNEVSISLDHKAPFLTGA